MESETRGPPRGSSAVDTAARDDLSVRARPSPGGVGVAIFGNRQSVTRVPLVKSVLLAAALALMVVLWRWEPHSGAGQPVPIPSPVSPAPVIVTSPPSVHPLPGPT